MIPHWLARHGILRAMMPKNAATAITRMPEIVSALRIIFTSLGEARPMTLQRPRHELTDQIPADADGCISGTGVQR